jgi:hypothetical protein
MDAGRDVLKSGLRIRGCAACEGLGIDAGGSGARADRPTKISRAGYELWFIGAQRETIMNGKLAAALDLKTLADRPHLYGLGPIEQLRGEATIADSRAALAHIGHVILNSTVDRRWSQYFCCMLAGNREYV